MKTSKILLIPNDIKKLEDYKKLGVTNFLFPLKDYSIGYNEFTYDEIEKTNIDAYILVNRLLTDDEIDNFMNLRAPENVKGFVIEDTGLYYELKDSNYTLINFQNHLNNNYKTINFWLERFSSAVLSTDITFQELKEILDKANKPLVVNTVTYPMIMYSRRHLVTNYYKHLDLDEKNEIEIQEEKSNIDFKLKENNYGTSVFDNHLLDIRSYLKDLNDDKVLFYMINTNFLDDSTIMDVLNGKEIPNSTIGFLDKKTVYRVGDLK